jgi:hypothetical protein
MNRVRAAESAKSSNTDLSSAKPLELRNEIEQIRGELAATVAALTSRLDIKGRVRQGAVVAVVAVTMIVGWKLIRRRRR